MLLFGCVTPPQEVPNNTAPAPAVIGTNATNQPASTNATASNQPLPKDYAAKFGDTATVDYTLWVDGIVYDTDNMTLANESGIYNSMRIYRPLTFKLELNKSMINGFVLNVVGMQVNETVKFNVPPALGYGNYNPSKVLVIPRYYNKSIEETVPLSYFAENNITVSKGTGFNTKFGTVFIQDFNDENATIVYMLEPGQTIFVNGLPEKVIHLYNITAQMEFMLNVNESYVLPDPTTGVETWFLVTNKTDTNITLDSNNRLANKTLEFEVTLLNVTRGS
jgi:FKBP-type peptidyl-prolyl cis-trans isomerase 2